MSNTLAINDRQTRSSGVAEHITSPSPSPLSPSAGQEADVIILSLSRSSLTDFLSDLHRSNVACSRARKRLHIVGNLALAEEQDSGGKDTG